MTTEPDSKNTEDNPEQENPDKQEKTPYTPSRREVLTGLCGAAAAGGAWGLQGGKKEDPGSGLGQRQARKRENQRSFGGPENSSTPSDGNKSNGDGDKDEDNGVFDTVDDFVPEYLEHPIRSLQKAIGAGAAAVGDGAGAVGDGVESAANATDNVTDDVLYMPAHMTKEAAEEATEAYEAAEETGEEVYEAVEDAGEYVVGAIGAGIDEGIKTAQQVDVSAWEIGEGIFAPHVSMDPEEGTFDVNGLLKNFEVGYEGQEIRIDLSNEGLAEASEYVYENVEDIEQKHAVAYAVAAVGDVVYQGVEAACNEVNQSQAYSSPEEILSNLSCTMTANADATAYPTRHTAGNSDYANIAGDYDLLDMNFGSDIVEGAENVAESLLGDRPEYVEKQITKEGGELKNDIEGFANEFADYFSG